MWIFDLESEIRRLVCAPSPLVRCRQRTWRLKLVTCHRLPVLVAYCLLPTAFCLYAASARYEVREVKPKVFVWIPEDILDQDGDPEFSRAGTAGFVITQDGGVVVNTTNSPMHARELLFEIRRRTDLPVKYVILTDSQGDHVLGNEVFADQQASIISTTAAQAEMRQYQLELARRREGDWRLQARLRGLHFTPSNRTFQGETTLQVGGHELKLLDLGAGQSPGDTAVYLPQLKVLFVGDLFENKYIPRPGSRDVHRWIETLRWLEGWDVETYVPGHGAPASKKDLIEFREFLEWLSNEVDARIHQGKSLAQVKNEMVPFQNYPWHAPELASELVDAVFKQLASQQAAASNSTSARPN